MSRFLLVFPWLIAPLLCLALYQTGLRTWFQQDDFAWLGLGLEVEDFNSFLRATFEPRAQGTIRPLSERLFFMSFYSLFGMEALPYRLWVFFTQFGVLTLIVLVMRSITGSLPAGVLAASLYTVNASLAIPLSWTSAYNQVLLSFILLLALYCFIRYIQTQSRKARTAEWIVFLSGFGVLELNVVYPALALLYALCRAPRFWKLPLPMFAVSAIYFFVHRQAGTKKSETYRMFFDSSIFSTLGTYIRWGLGGERLAEAHGFPLWTFQAAAAIAGAGLLLFAIAKLRRGDRAPLFFLGWFFGILAPLLPLKNHISDYYLAVPAIGLAMLGGWAVSEAWKKGAPMKTAAILCVLAYTVPSAWAGYQEASYNFKAARLARSFVRKVAYAHKRHPDKTLLIKGVSSELFWSGYYGDPFRLFGRDKIYLTADTEPHVVPFPEIGSISHYFLPEAAALHALRADQAVVYEIVEHDLRNVTRLYRRMLDLNEILQPARVDVGRAVFDGQLGEGWYPAEDGFRWMKKRGVVYIRGPEQGERLEVSGTCSELHMSRGPLTLTVSADGVPLRTDSIGPPNLSFTFRYDLPPALTGAKRIAIALETDRTVSLPNDDRTMSLVFGTVQLAR